MKRWAPLLLVLLGGVARADDLDGGTPESLADAGAETVVDNSPLAGLPAAEPLSFKAVLEKAEVPLAEPFHLTIEVRHSSKESYSLPAHLDLGDFGVRSHESQTQGEDPRITFIRLTMQAFAVGDRTIPPIHLSVETPDGLKQLPIPAQKIKVAGVIDDSQGPPQMKEDSRPLMSLYHWVLWPLWLLLAVAAGIGGALGWRYWKSRPPPGPPPIPRPPPFEEAMDRLRALEARNLVGAGRRQEFYFGLSEIVRDFAGRRYGFDSLEFTSDELLTELRGRPTPGLDYDGLERFLRDSDLVKFAKIEPTDGECKTILEMARAIIIRARPPLNPEETSPGRTP